MRRLRCLFGFHVLDVKKMAVVVAQWTELWRQGDNTLKGSWFDCHACGKVVYRRVKSKRSFYNLATWEKNQ